ncbi:13320_t:CDS:1 [Cetraspora pellucida]|uniref:13320_t:CDS:1 n=1 Tax=Cetraspora pellucida TaxID=1433469 RepID=A0ACA9K515_9GLOM|nr:13320_t:CDS:1 [Cetraspora pellucida]
MLKIYKFKNQNSQSMKKRLARPMKKRSERNYNPSLQQYERIINFPQPGSTSQSPTGQTQKIPENELQNQQTETNQGQAVDDNQPEDIEDNTHPETSVEFNTQPSNFIDFNTQIENYVAFYRLGNLVGFYSCTQPEGFYTSADIPADFPVENLRGYNNAADFPNQSY